jgi:hypothetical protein
MAKNARGVYSRKANKAGGGGSELAKDEGKHFVPGFLGREASKGKVSQGRTGYTEEKRLGPAGRGRKITLPTG